MLYLIMAALLGLGAIIAIILNKSDLAEKQLRVGRVLLGGILVFVLIMALITVMGPIMNSAG